jgi:beta-lactamase class A
MMDIALSRCQRTFTALSLLALAAGCRSPDRTAPTASSGAAGAAPAVVVSSRPAATAALTASAKATRPTFAALPADLAAVITKAEKEAQGQLGVAVLNAATGERFSWHGSERFPLQSVFKLPLAIAILTRVDVGDIRMDEMLRVRPIDVRPGMPGGLADELPALGAEKSVEDLLERSLVTSDNTATDVLLERLGGPQRVNERMGALGFFGIDVSRSEAELLMDFRGVSPTPPRDAWTYARLQELSRTPPEVRTRALAAALADPRDTATPETMAELLLHVHQRDLLKPASAAWLVDALGRVKTGKNRIRGLLPEGTPVAHKTGSSDTTDSVSQATNDAGIVTLPASPGPVVMVFFLKGSHAIEAARDHAIAVSARAVFDHYAPTRH